MTPESESWDTRLQRATDLARKADPAKEILTFYSKLLQSQKEVAKLDGGLVTFSVGSKGSSRQHDL